MASACSSAEVSEGATRFNHSIKVPRLYKSASKVLKDVAEKRSNFKSAIYQQRTRNRRDAVYALVMETLKYNSILEKLIDFSKLAEENRLERNLAKVLITESVIRKRNLTGQSKPILKILELNPLLKKKLKELLKKNNVETIEELKAGVSLPVYVRVNTLKTDVDKFAGHLGKNEFAEMEYDSETTYEGYLELVKLLEGKQFLRDFHVDNLFVFAPGTSFYDSPFYQQGKILIQDKASCFPPILLNPHSGSIVIDACAAPGMKTTLLAELMGNNGTIIAVELNEKRMKTLKETLSYAGVECAQLFLSDFSKIDPSSPPYCDAEYILLDPSCSGSGMANRLREGSATDTTESEKRLKRLACFQLKMLRHALSFPKVKRVVYSTCSVSITENEGVIAEAMEQYRDLFQLVHTMPEWPRRGRSDIYKDLGFAVRTEPKFDLMGGFFMAVIERK